MQTEDWPSVSAAEWADKVVEAMKRGDHIVGPGGRLALAKLASRGPAFVLDAISGAHVHAVAGLGEQRLHVGDAPLQEACLAVAQVQLPQSLEATVIAGGLEGGRAPRGSARASGAA